MYGISRKHFAFVILLISLQHPLFEHMYESYLNTHEDSIFVVYLNSYIIIDVDHSTNFTFDDSIDTRGR